MYRSETEIFCVTKRIEQLPVRGLCKSGERAVHEFQGWDKNYLATGISCPSLIVPPRLGTAE